MQVTVTSANYTNASGWLSSVPRAIKQVFYNQYHRVRELRELKSPRSRRTLPLTGLVERSRAFSRCCRVHDKTRRQPTLATPENPDPFLRLQAEVRQKRRLVLPGYLSVHEHFPAPI